MPSTHILAAETLLTFAMDRKPLEEGDRRQETGDRRKITWGF
ncbi:hypothetical protein [Okeania sp. SIO1F9]|nr:hypothetical protein [Okeania sp. SIO1F9]